VAEIDRLSSSLPLRLQPRIWGRLRERARVSSLDADGSRRVAPLVLGMAAIAGAAIWFLSPDWQPVQGSAFWLAAMLVALGLFAEFLNFNHSKESAGSPAVIPFAAAVLVAPTLLTVALIVGAEIGAQTLHRRPVIKAAFNISQHALGLALGITAFGWASGHTFISAKGLSFFETVQVLFVPTVLLLGIHHFTNNTCVSAAIAVSSRKRFIPLWMMHMRHGVPNVLVSVVLTFYLCWLSVNLGFMGTAGMAIPILLVRQLYRSTIELTNVTEELLELMVAAIEARDAYTSGHSRRVAKASEIIARALGLAPADVERVTVAALLHDVGKIDERFGPILAKEGRLTPEEWDVMKQHPVRGAELVGLLSRLRDIVPSVRHHHENWDGTGYPEGLRGEKIPVASRIIMFADTLDAITTDRPYRKALGIEEARSEFIRFRGKQFDPTICDRVIASDVWAELYVCFARTERLERRVS
jgi:putative nucleotidyltransferase with HDIG domain